MFSNKIKIFLVTLCFMLSIAAASAAPDTNATSVQDDSETGDVEVDPPSGNVKLMQSNTSSNNEVISTVDTASSSNNEVISTVDTGSSSNSEVISQDYNQEVVISGEDISMYYKNGTRYEISISGDNISDSSVIFNINGMNYTKSLVDGKSSIGINLEPGKYTITTFYKYSDKVITKTNTINILSTTVANDVVKYYKNGTQYYATFLDGNGNPLANTTVSFNINGVFYTRQTNGSGVARLNINLNPNTYVLTAIHPNGLQYSNNITILPTISGNNIIKYYKNGTQYYATFLDDNGNPLINTSVSFNINGVFYTRQTDDNGVARLNINLDPNTYVLTAIHPNGLQYANNITVLSTIIASDISGNESTFNVTIPNSENNPVNVSITINGVQHIVSTVNGVASLDISNLTGGSYSVVSENLETGEKIYNTISLPSETQYYSCYGVSPDGKYIMAIGRPSASGELSKYGYTFYKSVFLRVCPCCGSTNLYWGIFWAGSETANYGVFPATGNKEGGSAEGHIFCADCDADFSAIDGKNHGSGKDLTKVTTTVSSSKAEAYALKNGEIAYSEL